MLQNQEIDILKSGDRIKCNKFKFNCSNWKTESVEVKEKLRVGYFTSGNELKDPSETLM